LKGQGRLEISQKIFLRNEGGKMASVKTILVPTDFSLYSDRAMQYAAMLARAFKARILMIHVIEPLTYSVTDTLTVTDHFVALKTIAKPLLENARKKYQKRGLSVETDVLSGAPYREILQRARRAGVDMIVMGTHGRTGVEHFLLGSVAEKVVRLAPCPVVTVRPVVRAKADRKG
jgi:nucleotide-binding universal stress UspA family protein